MHLLYITLQGLEDNTAQIVCRAACSVSHCAFIGLGCGTCQHCQGSTKVAPGVSASICVTSPLPLLCHQISSKASKLMCGKSCLSAAGCRPTSDDNHMRSLQSGSTTAGHAEGLPKASSAVCRALVSGEIIRTSGFGSSLFVAALADVACLLPSGVRRVS